MGSMIKWRSGFAVIPYRDTGPLVRIFLQEQGAEEPRLLSKRPITWSDWRDSEEDCLRMDAWLYSLEAGCLFRPEVDRSLCGEDHGCSFAWLPSWFEGQYATSQEWRTSLENKRNERGDHIYEWAQRPHQQAGRP